MFFCCGENEQQLRGCLPKAAQASDVAIWMQEHRKRTKWTLNKMCRIWVKREKGYIITVFLPLTHSLDLCCCCWILLWHRGVGEELWKCNKSFVVSCCRKLLRRWVRFPNSPICQEYDQWVCEDMKVLRPPDTLTPSTLGFFVVSH